MIDFAQGIELGEGRDPLDEFYAAVEFLTHGYRRVGDRNYPPQFYAGLAHRAHPADVARMRRALAGIPRLDPRDYDILLNAETQEWSIVKWIALPEVVMVVPDGTVLVQVIREPFPVYDIDARKRSPMSLGEKDWERMRSLCVTMRDPAAITGDLRESQAAHDRDRAREAADFEHDLLSYYHAAIRREAEETGMAYASPEEMARRFGGRPQDFDPDYIPGGY